MTHGINQPTLLSPRPDLDTLARALGPYYACAWCALERSRTISAPAAFDPLTLKQLLAYLAAAGVVDPAPQTDSPTRRSRYDPITWSYTSAWESHADLSLALTAALDRWRVDMSAEVRLGLWQTLADSEVAAYLTTLLRRAQISSSFASRVIYEQDETWSKLSIGRRRYVAWSGIRTAALELLRTDMNEQAAVAAMCREMRERSRWLQKRSTLGELRASDFCFLPAETWNRPIIIDVAIDQVLQVGRGYWSIPPTGHPA